MSKVQLARELIEKFPHTSKKELGKMLYKLNPLIFANEEEGRSAIRSVTGANNGRGKGILVTHKDIYKGLPKGRVNDFTPHKLAPGKYGILSDIHIPYHDLAAVELAIEYFHKEKIKNIILNGDIIDCFQLSRWDRVPTEARFNEELKMLKAFIRELLKSFRVVYKLGNHEERFEHYIMQKAPDLWGMEILSWDSLVGNKEVTIVKGKRVIQAGKLNILHGHEYGPSLFSPVNTARGLYLRAKASSLCGHSHQTSEHSESNIRGSITGVWSTGCLCDLHPLYAPLNKWNLGFAIVDHDGEEFEVMNHKIINGKIK